MAYLAYPMGKILYFVLYFLTLSEWKEWNATQLDSLIRLLFLSVHLLTFRLYFVLFRLQNKFIYVCISGIYDAL